MSPEERSAKLLHYISPVLSELERSEEVLTGFLSSQYSFIQTLIRHIERFRGKRLRPALLHLSARAYGGEAPLAFHVAAVVEMIHLATLCHDDILDEAATRRSMPTINAEWGNKSAVMTGDILFSRAFEQLSKLDDVRPIKILSRTARLICEGELLQIASRFNTQIEEEDYLDLVMKKTAALFGAAAELGALLAGAKVEEAKRLDRYGRHLGMAFQIVDDCLDLQGVESTVGKSLGSDLKNGEPTLPLIHLFATASSTHRRELSKLFRPGSKALTRDALRPYLDRYGSIAYAFKTARSEVQRAQDELTGLPPSAALTVLQQIPEYVLDRTF